MNDDENMEENMEESTGVVLAVKRIFQSAPTPNAYELRLLQQDDHVTGDVVGSSDIDSQPEKEIQHSYQVWRRSTLQVAEIFLAGVWIYTFVWLIQVLRNPRKLVADEISPFTNDNKSIGQIYTKLGIVYLFSPIF